VDLLLVLLTIRVLKLVDLLPLALALLELALLELALLTIRVLKLVDLLPLALALLAFLLIYKILVVV
jgi:hypothetical protein